MNKIPLLLLLLLTNSCLLSSKAYAGGIAVLPSLNGPVDELAVISIVGALIQVQSMPVEQRPEVLVLNINSPGGLVEEGFLLVQAIEQSPIPVMCVVDGTAASMGFYILQACDRRVMTARSSLMWHSVSINASVNSRNIESVKNRITVLNAGALNHVAKKMKIPKEEIAERLSFFGDWWIDADEALKIGAVDAVIP